MTLADVKARMDGGRKRPAEREIRVRDAGKRLE